MKTRFNPLRDSVVYTIVMHWQRRFKSCFSERQILFKTRPGTVHVLYTLNRLLQLATQNPRIFSKEALEKRKLPHAGKHMAKFMRTAYIPKKGDFQRLQTQSEILEKETLPPAKEADQHA